MRFGHVEFRAIHFLMGIASLVDWLGILGATTCKYGLGGSNHPTPWSCKQTSKSVLDLKRWDDHQIVSLDSRRTQNYATASNDTTNPLDILGRYCSWLVWRERFGANPSPFGGSLRSWVVKPDGSCQAAGSAPAHHWMPRRHVGQPRCRRVDWSRDQSKVGGSWYSMAISRPIYLLQLGI